MSFFELSVFTHLNPNDKPVAPDTSYSKGNSLESDLIFALNNVYI